MAGMTVAKLLDRVDLLLRDVARVLGEYSRVIFSISLHDVYLEIISVSQYIKPYKNVNHVTNFN